MRSGWTALVLLLVFSGSVGALLSEQDDRDLASALELRVNKQPEAALELLKQIEERNPDNLGALHEVSYQRGLILESTGHLEEALAAYAVSLKPGIGQAAMPFALMSCARVQGKIGRLEESVKGYTQLLQNYPRFGGPALLARAAVEEQAGRPLAAARSYRLLLHSFPLVPEVKHARQGLAALCATLLKRPPSSTAFGEIKERGDCLMDQDHFDEAELWYQNALEKRGLPVARRGSLLLELGHCYEIQAKYGQAVRTFRKAERVLRGSAQAAVAQMAIVQIHLDRNRLGHAIRELHRVVKKYPHTSQAAQAQFMIGSCHESLREHKKAETEYRKVLEMAPKGAWAFEAQQSLMRLLEQRR